MISITRLIGGSQQFGDTLRYSEDARSHPHGTGRGRGPVVVWNCTRRCNLRCLHCYSNSKDRSYSGEMSTVEALRFIDDLAAFKVPVILFSGGEPLLRGDLAELAAHASRHGIRPTVSSNGTLLEKSMIEKLKNAGTSYIGVSLDGLEETNDRFRGKRGAFAAALRGIRKCLELGQRVGLRFTINKHNYKEVSAIFDLVEEENIPRVCFYHLVYTGRGGKMKEEDISREETRAVMDLILERTYDFCRRGLEKEVLTVDNHADGVYTYFWLKKNLPSRAEEALALLKLNGGNRSGMAIGAVDWYGNVHPDQFTQNYTLGNVKEKSFGSIWTDTSHPIMAGLKNRRPLLKGRCAACRWLDICNGNFRARAEAVTGDFWESDPACYLTDEEIGLA